jgi:hypothetical protein
MHVDSPIQQPRTPTRDDIMEIPDGGTFHIEDIQDLAEIALMRTGHPFPWMSSVRPEERAKHFETRVTDTRPAAH